jgi:3-methyladenine DNA glycosylase Tag
MEGPPPQIAAKSLDDYLEQLSKGVFQAGISWRVVDAKWPSIKKAFHGFNVERVARMKDRDIDALVKDERVIRSRPKIAAVVHNANELLALERAGGFKKHLKSFPEYEALASDLKKRFKFVGDSGAYHFLWTVKHPVPDWHDWSRAHGMNWEEKMKASGARQAARTARTTRSRAKGRSPARAAR